MTLVMLFLRRASSTRGGQEPLRSGGWKGSGTPKKWEVHLLEGGER